jgi:hypothetical protein
MRNSLRMVLHHSLRMVRLDLLIKELAGGGPEDVVARVEQVSTADIQEGISL